MESIEKIPKLRFPNFIDSWKNVKLGDIAKVYDGTHQTPVYVENGIPFYSVEQITSNNFNNTKYVSNEVFEKENKRVRLEKGDIIMTRIGDIGTSRYIDWDVNASFYVSIALIKQSRSYNSEFLSHYISTKNFQKELWNRTIHVAFPKKINLGEISECKLNLPNLNEQEKIAIFLTTIDTKFKALKKKKELMEQYKKGLMQMIFSQKLRFKDKNGVDFPDWKEKLLSEVCQIIMGQSPDSKSYNSNGIGTPLIQGNADIKDRYTFPRNWTTDNTKLCSIGDIILTVRAPVGAVARSIHNACIGRGVCAIRSNTISNQNYIYHFLIFYESRWKSIEQGSTFTAVSGSDIKNIKLNLPSLSEQNNIAELLNNIDKRIKEISFQMELTENWKKGLLQQLFV